MLKKIKRIGLKIKEKLIDIKQWLYECKLIIARNIPIPEDDKLMHFMLAYYLSIPVSVWHVADHRIGFYGLGAIMAGAFIWEIPNIVKNKFSYASFNEASKDIAMAFMAIFPQLVLMIQNVK